MATAHAGCNSLCKRRVVCLQWLTQTRIVNYLFGKIENVTAENWFHLTEIKHEEWPRVTDSIVG